MSSVAAVISTLMVRITVIMMLRFYLQEERNDLREKTVLNDLLTLSTMHIFVRTRHIEILSYFSQKTGFDISCNLSRMETIRMKLQILFSGKN